MKLYFEITQIPHSFDNDDDIHNLLNDAGIEQEIEFAIADILEKYNSRKELNVTARRVRKVQKCSKCKVANDIFLAMECTCWNSETEDECLRCYGLRMTV